MTSTSCCGTRLLTAVFIACSSLLPASGIQVGSEKPQVSSDIEELLWWLPPDTETIQVTQTPAKPRGPLFDGMEHARGVFVGGDAAWAGIATQHLKGARIDATVDGSRRFAPPSGLGEMLYEGALIMRFAKPLGKTGTRLMTDLRKRALNVDQFDGLEILEFRDTLENDTWTSCVTIPRADVVVVATNRSYLEELLRRRKTRIGMRGLPPQLPEWQWVDVSASFWALRHYRRDAPDDPTSPFGRPNVLDGFDPAAVGVTAHVNSDGRTIVAHYLSQAATAERIARRIWHHPGDGVDPAFRRVGNDAVEVRFVAKDVEDLSMFFYYLLAALGHATYL